MRAVLLSLLTVGFVAVLLLAESRQRPRQALVVKGCASLCFVLLGWVGLGQPPSRFDLWVLAGLICAALGDVLLALPGNAAFQAGIGAFGVGHALYIVAAYVALDGALPPAWTTALLVPSLGAYAWLYPHLGAMRVAVGVYVALITAMVAYALALYLAAPGFGAWFLAGATLFYASDLSVARDRFVRNQLINRLWGLPAYYVGQLLIAYSLALE
ncbi:MAG TPA: lysoplasmalogenase [Polyangiales bacterium]